MRLATATGILIAVFISLAHGCAYAQTADYDAIATVVTRHGFSQFDSHPHIHSDTPADAGILLNQPSPFRDKDGLKRDTYYFMAYQFAVIAVLYVMPESISGWSEEQKNEPRFRVWWDHVTNPEWDSDDLYINYLLHPYWGGTYFVRAKERGFNNREALLYSALLSTLYEFGVEAIFENPSIQDLFVTPIAGYYVGKYFERVRQGIRDNAAQTGTLSTRDKLTLALTDPLGSMNRYIDRRLGKDAELHLQLVRTAHAGMGPPVGQSFSAPIAARVTLRF
jgi:hypothetical protein